MSECSSDSEVRTRGRASGFRALLFATAAVVCAACPADKEQATPGRLLEDASFGRRVFRPPPSDPVRAVPPHNIHTRGVGPYELSAALKTTLALLPNGPRVELFEAEGLFDYRLMRSDGDALLLGVGRRGGVAFISVLDPDIAKTESGVGVGAGVQELIGALGALKAPANQGRDSRIITFTALPDTRFIVEKGKVVAAVVMPPSEREAAEPSSEAACDTAELEARRKQLLRLAKSEAVGGERGAVSARPICLGPDRPIALLRHGDRIGIASLDGEEVKVVATGAVDDLRFVTALDTGAPRPELFAVSEKRSLELREVVVTRLALTGAKLLPNWKRVAFSMEAKTASWIGAQMQTAAFLVEMWGRPGAVEIGGIYLERVQGALRHVVPVDPIELPLSRETPKPQPAAPPSSSAVPPDAGKPAPRAPSRDAKPGPS